MAYLLLAAAVLLVLFYYVPKRAAIILGVFTAAIITLALIIYWQDQNETRQFDLVDVVLAVDENLCPAEESLQYRVNNHAEDTVYRVHFYYVVYREGYSTAVSRSYRNEITINRIIEPGGVHEGCVASADIDETIPGGELRFELDRKRVWFEPPVI